MTHDEKHFRAGTPSNGGPFPEYTAVETVPCDEHGMELASAGSSRRTNDSAGTDEEYAFVAQAGNDFFQGIQLPQVSSEISNMNSFPRSSTMSYQSESEQQASTYMSAAASFWCWWPPK